MQTASPQEVDLVFFTNMVPHHAAAVPMAQLELEQGSYEPGMQIKHSQLRAIDMMKGHDRGTGLTPRDCAVKARLFGYARLGCLPLWSTVVGPTLRL